MTLWAAPTLQVLARPAWANGSPAPGQTGSVTGQVTNAQTGAAIGGATVTGPGGASTTTDADGFYALSSVPTGSQTLTASAPGFLSQNRVVTLTTGSNVVNFALAAADVEQILVTLSWGTVPRDLDLHMSGPDGTGGRFHAFYLNPNPTPFVSQDVDDVDGNGPENDTITMTGGSGAGFEPGTYRVWVHNFSDQYGDDNHFGTGTATVTLTGAGGQVLSLSEDDVTIGAPTQFIWRAFDFDLDAAGVISNLVVVQQFLNGDQNTTF